jgi:hypothetical protein
MYLAPHDNTMPPLPSRECIEIRHPGQVPQSGTRAGMQRESDYIALSLDSPSTSLRVVSLSNHGSRPPRRTRLE